MYNIIENEESAPQHGAVIVLKGICYCLHFLMAMRRLGIVPITTLSPGHVPQAQTMATTLYTVSTKCDIWVEVSVLHID
jgi:hypothetical protein